MLKLQGFVEFNSVNVIGSQAVYFYRIFSFAAPAFLFSRSKAYGVQKKHVRFISST